MLQGVVCVVHMVLQNVDVCCGALPRSPVMWVTTCRATRCSILQCVEYCACYSELTPHGKTLSTYCSVLQHTATRCRLLWRVQHTTLAMSSSRLTRTVASSATQCTHWHTLQHSIPAACCLLVSIRLAGVQSWTNQADHSQTCVDLQCMNMYRNKKTRMLTHSDKTSQHCALEQDLPLPTTGHPQTRSCYESETL